MCYCTNSSGIPPGEAIVNLETAVLTLREKGFQTQRVEELAYSKEQFIIIKIKIKIKISPDLKCHFIIYVEVLIIVVMEVNE
jgi:hypothetical protein